MKPRRYRPTYALDRRCIAKKTLASLLAVALTSPAFANNLQTGPLATNTDFALYGVSGLRGTGSGSITVTGVSGTVTRAILVWHGITNTTAPLARSGTINTTNFVGTNIGQSDNNCWGATESQAFQADVTSAVTGNGVYALSNLRNAAQFDPNGASLLVYFNDGNSSNNRDVAVFWGNDSNVPNAYDALGWRATLSGINFSGGAANATLVVSDGQNFGAVAGSTLNINSGTVQLPNFRGNTLPLASGSSVTDGGLWDHYSFSVNSFLNPGPNALSLSAPIVEPPSSPSANDADCVSLVATVFDFPAGSITAPTATATNVVPTLSVAGLGGLSLACALWGVYALRRREQRLV